ncbi:MAG TPA: hypothetical protein VFN64_00580 [Burkholderiaceae bacterium]|nr:hypothetical protein [Burkholderiaceae bacterium]
MARRPEGPMFRNRIVGVGEEPPDQLLANPANAWKIHPEVQQDELEKVMETVGWVRRVLVNRRTGHVVDGHLRVQLALRRQEETVPVTYVDISEAEEKLLITVMDPLAGMVIADREALAEIRTEVAASFPEAGLDLDAILQREQKVRAQGLTHEVHECTCCRRKCTPKCGCWREDGRKRRAAKKKVGA